MSNSVDQIIYGYDVNESVDMYLQRVIPEELPELFRLAADLDEKYPYTMRADLELYGETQNIPYAVRSCVWDLLRLKIEQEVRAGYGEL